MENSNGIPPITIYGDCFGKDVKVLMMDGSRKCVNEVLVGDRLMGFDKGVLTVGEIYTSHDTEILQVKCENGKEIMVSGGHPMMSKGQCVRVTELKVGDYLNLEDGTLTKIISKYMVPYNDKVYNFSFYKLDTGSYIIANGFVSGDLLMQYEKEEKTTRICSEDDIKLMDEMMLHIQELHQENNRL